MLRQLPFLFLLLLLPLRPATAVEIAECKGALEPSIAGNCSGIDFAGCCDPMGRVLWCKNNNLFCLNCSDGFGFCGWNPNGDYYDCGFDEPTVDPGGEHPYGCGDCSPLCVEGADCSADCPGSCGSCSDGDVCLDDGTCYAPQCQGKECGLDPLGFSCGQCDYGQECVDGIQKCMPLPEPCLPSQDPGCGGCACEACVCQTYPNCCNEKWDIFCIAACEFECGYDCSACPENPSCDGLECGDYCGVQCGTCDEGELCFSGQCCLPDCTGKVCGTDGCGGTCGECSGYDECKEGACVQCKPKCEGKKCGPDGCGGSCGECPSGAKCDDGICKKATCAASCGGSSPWDCWCDNQCQEFGDCCPDFCEVCPDMCKEEEGCGTIEYEGCCAGNTIKYCQNNELIEASCGNDPVCGWNSEDNYYDCGTDGEEDPSGDFPMACPCLPDCEGKECGDDGCGALCGECPGKGAICTDEGQCCTPDCKDKECGDNGCGIPCGNCAEGQWCDFGACIDGVPGGCEVSENPGCDGCGCEACVFDKDDFCEEGHWDGECVQLCQQCGTTCPCLPACEGMACGDDGCGGSCGDCPIYEYCLNGECLPDNCEGILWEGCCEGEMLSYCESGMLQQQDCSGQSSCGWSADNQYYDCNTSGEEDPSEAFPMGCDQYCQPQCQDKECGDDACGGSCGECLEDQLCVKGECIINQCGDITYEGCCDGIKVKWCEDAILNVKYCDGFPGECGWQAPLGYDCGTDGAEEPTGAFPKWCPGACVPDCEDKECGKDGCGGDCGTCTNHAKCIEGLCDKPDVPGPDAVGDSVTTESDASAPADGQPEDAAVQVVEETKEKEGGSGGCSQGSGSIPGTVWLLAALLALLLAAARRSKRAPIALCLATLLAIVACSGTTSDSTDAVVEETAAEDTPTASDADPDLVLPDGVIPELVIPDVTEVDDSVIPDDTGEVIAPDVPSEETVEEDTIDPDLIEKMCLSLPKGPLKLTKVPGAIASEDLAFDSEGFLVGGNNQAIFKSDSSGKSKIFVPNLQFRAGLRYTPSGRLIVCDNNLGRLLAVDPDGSVEVLLQGLKYPNGLEVDLKGYVYLSEHDASKVLRIHPYTGEFTVLTTEINNPNGMSFNVDYTILYIGSFGSPYIYQMSIAEDGTPGRLEVFADMTDTPGLLDGMAVDICGNVYICEYGDTDIYRVSPDGQHKTLLVDESSSETYLPNMQWGVAPHWNPHSFYVPDGWNIGVWTVDIGIPGKPRPYP